MVRSRHRPPPLGSTQLMGAAGLRLIFNTQVPRGHPRRNRHMMSQQVVKDKPAALIHFLFRWLRPIAIVVATLIAVATVTDAWH